MARDLMAELDALRTSLETQWKDLTPEQAELIRQGGPLLEAVGKSIDVAATFDALERWIALDIPAADHPIEITCRPGDAILRLSAETVANLDRLGQTLPTSTPWQIDLAIGRTAADTVHLTATPATEPTPEEDDAA